MQANSSQKLARSIAALGVVYGDIGTSVLYAFKECLTHGLHQPSEVIGVLSLIIWSLFTLVSLKYLGLIMRADNHGEGGILALLSLAFPDSTRQNTARCGRMVALGIFGAALLYGDGVITPAISVLSAVEGLSKQTPSTSLVPHAPAASSPAPVPSASSLSPTSPHTASTMHSTEPSREKDSEEQEKPAPYVIPLTLGILVGLFALQHKGTGALGVWFGRIMLGWFVLLGVLGAAHIADYPAVLQALNPIYGFRFILEHGMGALAIMGSVFLVVTGGEALYADMGHFGRKPIARAWVFLVFPALILNYLGQGALTLSNPALIEDRSFHPFFALAPGWAQYPLVAIATAAAIIASQALISGAFSLTMQGIQMGYIPRMEICHTSKDEHGQIYIPKINILLGIGCMTLVLTFQSSTNLASAYGIAVTLTMLATTVLFYFAARRLWVWSPLRAGLTCAGFAAIELVFFTANSLKILNGGWFPLVLGLCIFTAMTTWKSGRRLLQIQMAPPMPLDDFIASLAMAGTLDEHHKLHRSPGTAVFLAGNPTGTPNALVKNIKHNQLLHSRNILLTIQTDQTRPYVPQDQRVTVADLSEGFHRIVAQFGFMESPHIGEVIRAAGKAGVKIDPDRATFFVGKERIIPTARKRGMALWREHLFVFLSKHSENAADFFQLPPERVYEVSQVVEI
jgi:KUP system potassium uptake protein